MIMPHVFANWALSKLDSNPSIEPKKLRSSFTDDYLFFIFPFSFFSFFWLFWATLRNMEVPKLGV